MWEISMYLLREVRFGGGKKVRITSDWEYFFVLQGLAVVNAV